MNKLTHEDIGILIEALDAWVQRKQSGELVGELLEGLLAPKEAGQELKAKREERRREAAREKQLDADTATLLKAKLIKLRQEEFAA
jgi:hypothetical protein